MLTIFCRNYVELDVLFSDEEDEALQCAIESSFLNDEENETKYVTCTV